jgi:phosphatidate cytidylyltransferase
MAMLFMTSFGSDVFAYLVGVTVKGPKLCPGLSPKKTVSGAVGGLLGGVIGAMIVFGLYWWGLLGGMPEIPFYHFPLIGVVASLFTQFGDLVASYIKRYCGIKDFSNAFPGHGGFMDRLDGLIFNSAALYFYLMIFFNVPA